MQTLKDLLLMVDEKGLIESRWRKDFIEFVRDGSASQAFMEYLDSSEDCRRAVDLAFEMQAEAIQALAKALERSA